MGWKLMLLMLQKLCIIIAGVSVDSPHEKITKVWRMLELSVRLHLGKSRFFARFPPSPEPRVGTGVSWASLIK